MLQTYKKDEQLGLEVHQRLVEQGIETPFISGNWDPNWLSTDSNHTTVEEAMAEILGCLKLNLDDESLAKTPKRVAKMFLDEIFYGLDYGNFPKMTSESNKFSNDQMIVEKSITFRSTCEHHFIVIDGFADVAYIPRNRVVGLSKLNRLVDFFGRRPQVQERATSQIHCALEYVLQTPDIAVQLHSNHFCVKHRGIMDQHSSTVTSKLGGAFLKEDSARSEFYALTRIKG